MNREEVKRRAIRLEREGTLRCLCDLDRWEPESTGHTWKCPIHMAALNPDWPIEDGDQDEKVRSMLG